MDVAALLAALKQKDIAALRALLAADPALADARTPEGMHVLQLAAYLRAPALVEALRAAGAQPDLFAAAALGDEPSVRRLVAADPDALVRHGPDGAPALHLAAHFGHLDVVRALLASGAPADLFAGGFFSNTALHAAAAGGQTQVMLHLLAAGARPDLPDANGFTPLHLAAANGLRAAVDALLDKGAARGAVAKDGRSPADLARERGHADLEARLR